jgi:hypothetical protein
MFRFISALIFSKSLFGKRSPKWKKVRNDFIKNNPLCAACGTKKNLEVHHVKPYNVYPELELDKNNLVTLCRDHHFTFGHFCDWHSWNENVITDVVIYNSKRLLRPRQNP